MCGVWWGGETRGTPLPLLPGPAEVGSKLWIRINDRGSTPGGIIHQEPIYLGWVCRGSEQGACEGLVWVTMLPGMAWWCAAGVVTSAGPEQSSLARRPPRDPRRRTSRM